MRETHLIMGMPIEIEVVGDTSQPAIEDAFAYLAAVDERFSTYKDTSEIAAINSGSATAVEASEEMQEVFALAEKTRNETRGFFNICRPDGRLDPSGIVKGWAVLNAARRIAAAGHAHFFINAGGDVATSGKNARGEDWVVGVRNPFNPEEVVKRICPQGKGVATSGSYLRGAHIYNPHNSSQLLDEMVSITIIGPDVLEADRYATAAFAMGREGVFFIESLPGFEAYAIDRRGVATMTSGFEEYTKTCQC
ncbi:MAG: FAD:protein FMN transferase [Candidatus Paceibacterota bacterium]